MFKALKWFTIGYFTASMCAGWGMKISRKMGLITIETDPEVIAKKTGEYFDKITSKVERIVDNLSDQAL